MAGSNRQPEAHVLKQLIFPARYEQLIQMVGAELAKLLVAPPSSTLDVFEMAGESIKARGEGLFVPMLAISGTGKTTLAHSLQNFFPQHYAETVDHIGNVDFHELCNTVSRARDTLPFNDQRILPVNVDHREGNPPSNVELANIKRFLRDKNGGNRVLLLWPETAEDVANNMAEGYIKIAGRSPIGVPVNIQGPLSETWASIAVNTLQVTNNVDSLEDLGVNPEDYKVDEYHSLGDYLRHISDDFTSRRLRILRSTRRPIRLVVVFATGSSDAGVLTQLTSSNRFGLVDASALLDATKTSVIGRWWRDHRGLLTQMVMQLDTRIFGLPPSVTVPILSNFGPEPVKISLNDMGVNNAGRSAVNRVLSRSDLGKYLNGTVTPTSETRGTPANVSLPAFELLAEVGFTAGRDKLLNKSLLDAIELFLGNQEIECSNPKAEKVLGFTPLIPDLSFDLGEDTFCIELTWRAGDFLTTKNRAAIAGYVLTKLQNYARELNYV